MTTSPALLGKHCVVTGGSRGIGAAIAELFAARGARCTLVGRDAGALEAAVRRLPVVLAPLAAAGGQRESQQEDQQQQQQHPYPDHPHHHRVHAMDVSDPDVWAQLVAKTKPVSACMSPSLLVFLPGRAGLVSPAKEKKRKLSLNEKQEKTHILVNAAGTSQNSLLHRTSAADARRVLDTNLLGTVLGCQAFVPQMMRQREGELSVHLLGLGEKGGGGQSLKQAESDSVTG